MLIRAYTDADLDALRAMHSAQNFAYELPDVADPLFVMRAVVEEDGKPRMAALLRLTAEAYLLADPHEGTPRRRWQWLMALHEATRRAAKARGLLRRAGVFAAAGSARIWTPTRNRSAGATIPGAATRGDCSRAQR